MEQSLVDTSKYKLFLQSLDSRYADQRSCENAEWKIVLPHPLKNIMRVRMASIELPLVEYLFSNQYGNLTFAAKIGANPSWVKLPPLNAGNYSASDIASAIQTRLLSLHSGFTVNIDSLNGKTIITNTSVHFQLYMASFDKAIASRPSYWGLGYYLGFRNNPLVSIQQSDGSYKVISESVLNVQQNQYYLLQLSCPEPVVNVTHVTSDFGFIDAFAKIVLKNGYFTIAFDDNQNLLRKEYSFLAPTTIPFFTFRLLNPFGEPVNMLNVDWSVTLELTEVVNSKTYTSISKTYARM
jgi:hypothetical protein